MRTETAYLMEHFPVRKSKKQKTAFLGWVTGVLKGAGYQPRVETEKPFGSRNLILGDPETAKVVFTAHYDTPARLLFPNFIVPESLLATLIAQLPLLAVIFAVIFGIEGLLFRFLPSPLMGMIATYALLLGTLYLIMAGPANPSNVNDNTSGTVTVLETALALPAELRGSVAFVLFDHEELGLFGSSGFYKRHKKAMGATLLVNFDCVSDGDHIRFFPGKRLKKQEKLLRALADAYSPVDGKTVAVVKGKASYPSDQKFFPFGVGVAALRRGFFGLCIGRIHTARDVIFEEKNIELLRDGSLSLAAAMSSSKA